MLPQSEFEPPMFASASAPVAIAAITQDRALIGLLRSVVDPSHDLILVNSESELTPHLNSRRVSAALLDSMFIEDDLAAMAERMRVTWPDLVLVVVGTAEEQSKVAAQITSGVVYRFLHRPVSAPRVRLFVDAALRRHEVENVERTLEQVRPDFSRAEVVRKPGNTSMVRALLPGILGAAAVLAAGIAWLLLSSAEDSKAPASAPVVSAPAATTATPAPEPISAASPSAPTAQDPEPQNPPAPESRPQSEPPAPTAVATAPVEPSPSPSPATPVAPKVDRLRPAASPGVMQVPDELAPQTPPALTHEQRLRELLTQAEAALQRGELASPPGRNAVALFTGALELDPSNTLAKAGLVRVADRLLSAAERAVTAGNAEDAKNMVDVAESLTPATARGAFLMMQIEMERERTALARAKESAAQDEQEKFGNFLRLANARLRSGALIEPSGDNARFYLEAARQIVPGDPALQDVTRALQRQLLDRAAGAAGMGNAAETERWLANADGAGAQRQEMTAIRRSLQDTLIGARAVQMSALTRSFTAALSANRLLEPANDNAKAHFLALIETDATGPAVVSARQGLGGAYVNELRGALARDQLDAAGTWLEEARTIGYAGAELDSLDKQLGEARQKAAQRHAVVGANSLQRLEYVAPKFPAATRNRGMSGWVELQFTVRADGSTADIVVTNSSPRRTFDNAAMTAVGQWRYKPVLRDGKAIEQRAAVRIRFADE
jgi:TonB family protein